MKTDARPTLEYGRAFPPGRVTVLDHPDGSVDVIIPPRPVWQPVLAGGAVLCAFLALFRFLGLLTGRSLWTVVPAMLCCVGILIVTVLLRWGREQFRIRASQQALLVWYVESGDDVLLDVPRADVLDVRAPGLFSQDKNHLIIETTRGKRFVMICRSRREIGRIAEAVRRGLGPAAAEP